MTRMMIVVRASWDEEAGVWVATSEDVPGLVIEAESQDQLHERAQALIPELLAENDGFGDMPEVPMVVMTETLTRLRLRA